MFVRIKGMIINLNHVIRIYPVFSEITEEGEVYNVTFEYSVGGKTEARNYVYGTPDGAHNLFDSLIKVTGAINVE